MSKIKYPFGARTVQSVAQAATMLPTDAIWNNKTKIEITSALGQNSTLDLTPHAEIEDGAEVNVQWLATGTETLAFDTDNIVAKTVTGVAGKRFSITLEWDAAESKFVAKGAGAQITN